MPSWYYLVYHANDEPGQIAGSCESHNPSPAANPGLGNRTDHLAGLPCR